MPESVLIDNKTESTKGQITIKDMESSEWLRPWIPVAYPAPYKPALWSPSIEELALEDVDPLEDRSW